MFPTGRTPPVDGSISGYEGSRSPVSNEAVVAEPGLFQAVISTISTLSMPPGAW